MIKPNQAKYRSWIGILLFGLGNLTSGCQMEKPQKGPIIIAHRGASGYLPEHTLAAKAMAYAFYPDYIEQDLVLTKDAVPIVIHDIHLETVTDVAQVFPQRKREDGRYYAIDFTFDEIRQLSVTERLNPTTGKAVFEGRFPIHKSYFRLHSLPEEIELIQGLNKSTGHNIGIYPEIKEPQFHRQSGMDISKIVLAVLKNYGYERSTDLCYLQCFDAIELQRIRDTLQSRLTLVQLMENTNEIPKIAAYAKYAQGIGPSLELLKNPELMEQAHKKQLFVHAYTLRADQIGDYRNFEDLVETVARKIEVDGVFTDHPDKVKAIFKQNR